MRILMVSNTYLPLVGGIERSIELFSKSLRERGHEVVVVTPRVPGSPRQEDGVIRLPSVPRVNHTDFSIHLPAPGLVERLMKRFEPEIVHAHHPFLLGDLALKLAAQYQLPLFFTYHTLFEAYTHYLPIQSGAAKRFVTQLAAGYANLADQVIAPSPVVRRLLKTHGVRSPIEVIPTGVDTEFFEPDRGTAGRAATAAFTVGYAGRLVLEKNLIFLVKAAARFLKANPDARFLCAGDGPLREELEAFFGTRGLRDRVEFMGVLSREKLAQAYRRMSVFAFASKTETQGMVILEALASGLPVVALKDAVSNEFLKEGVNGFLVQRENEEVFARALESVHRLKREDYRRMSAEARRGALEHSIGRSVEALLGLYEAARARFKARAERREDHSVWSQWRERIRVEWELLANYGKAAGAAIRKRKRGRRVRRR